MNIGIIGLGNVGKAFISLLAWNKDWLESTYNSEIKVVAVKDITVGHRYDPKGINLTELMELFSNEKSIADGTLASETMLDELSDVELVVECTNSEYVTGNPGYTFIKDALLANKHVITSNKGPVALKYFELLELAKKNGKCFKYESTVLSGTPVFNLADQCLRNAKIKSITGILNGTSNFILEEMSNGMGFEKSLVLAQENGYAEADPTNDIEGYDTRAKINILVKHFFGVDINLGDIETKGIADVTQKNIASQAKEGKVIKLVGRIFKEDGPLKCSVKPEALNKDAKLANVTGVDNAILFKTEYLGEVLLVGPGAGRLETGYGIYTDFLEILKTNL